MMTLNGMEREIKGVKSRINEADRACTAERMVW
jgi:hypothetical protein